MISDYELQIHKKDDGWDLIFTQGSKIQRAHITTLLDIEKYLEEWCEGYSPLNERKNNK